MRDYTMLVREIVELRSGLRKLEAAEPPINVAVGKTLKVEHSMTLSGADGRTLTIPDTGTAALLGTANVFTANQTINGNLVVDTNVLFVNAANNMVGIGLVNPQFQLHASLNNDQIAAGMLTGTNPILGLSGHSQNIIHALMSADDVTGRRAILRFDKARGTITSPTPIGNEDVLGDLLWGGYDGTGMIYSAGIISIVDGAPSTGTVPMRVSIVTGTNAGNRAERLRVMSDGNVGIGTTLPSAQLHIDQPSTTGAKPTLCLRQADLSEELIRFDATVGAGNPINTTALGSYYGRVRVWVEGVGAKWLALYN